MDQNGIDIDELYSDLENRDLLRTRPVPVSLEDKKYRDTTQTIDTWMNVEHIIDFADIPFAGLGYIAINLEKDTDLPFDDCFYMTVAQLFIENRPKINEGIRKMIDYHKSFLPGD